MPIFWLLSALVAVLIITDLFFLPVLTGRWTSPVSLIFCGYSLIFLHDYTLRPLGILGIYILIKLLFIMPSKYRKTTSKRLNFLYGGKRQLNLGIFASIFQGILYAVLFIKGKIDIFFVGYIVTYYLYLQLLVFVGMLRVIFTSKWLNVLKRVVCFFLIMLPPPLNWGVMFYLRHIAAKEYDYFRFKLEDMPREIKDRICQTKYPILLVHGVGFRDARYFNYWGRIPKELRRRGATVFYGNQEGWATIEHNASLLNKRVEEILKETGAEKINIIAHSKGGLDSRCMIHSYKLGDKIASLTTMGTPHYGVHFADVLLKILPAFIVNFISDCVNRLFYAYGDVSPDFNTAVHQLTEEYMAKFNSRTPDNDRVYYQSYCSYMRCMFSDYILSTSYVISRLVGSGKNDGLVPVSSAKWGNFKGVLETKKLHGVSHGDLIDLKREDFQGFDIKAEYIKIVSELKEMGF